MIEFPAIANSRQKGPSLARRKYQRGNVFQKGKKKSDTWDPLAPAYVSYRSDTPNGRHRQVSSLGPCRTRIIAERAAGLRLESLGINTTQAFIEGTSNVTFQQQGETWLKSLANRKRNPLEATTIANRRYTLDKWLYPRIGSELLSNISNRTMKELVEYFVDANLAASSIRDYTLIAKLVVASAIDDNGEELFPRKWKEDYIDAPIVKDQNQPTVDAKEISAIIRHSEGQLGVLYALLAGCGPLRVGEALGLEIRHVSADFRTLVINQKAKRGVIQPYLKTKNGEREIDLCIELATLLQQFIGSRTSGLLFSTAKGTQLSQANLLTSHLHPLLKKLHLSIGGFNIFRRFRMKHIDLSPVPKSLQHFWSGHAQTHISETYVHLLNDRPIRLEWAERLGMGFCLPGQPGQLIGLRKSA